MNFLKAVKNGFGYTWAVLCFVAVLTTFLGYGYWSKLLATGTGIRVSPWFSGGEVRNTVDHGDYRTLLHRPVFDGLISDRKEGFVQVDWVPAEKKSLPVTIQEEFDIDGNGSADFAVRVDGARAQLTSQAPWVLGLDPIIEIDSEKILRVRLRNPNR